MDTRAWKPGQPKQSTVETRHWPIWLGAVVSLPEEAIGKEDDQELATS